MSSIKIFSIEKEPAVCFSGKGVVLPLMVQKKIDAYWQSLMESGMSYTRGAVFTVTETKEINKIPEVLVEKTDYAHYLYCQNVDAELGGYGVRVLFTACLVETSDKKTIFGAMGLHTARSGIYQLCGGGIDKDDLVGENFNLRGSIIKELQEELGIDVSDTDRVQDFKPAYLKQGGKTKKIAVIYRVRLNETAETFMNRYRVFETKLKGKGECPEFGEIMVLDQGNKSIKSFLKQHQNHCDEYMSPLLRYTYFEG
jgi:8-oxo-dGTP pyrophosphatase MutT (NUDIX family)